jgi:hypothetical protein
VTSPRPRHLAALPPTCHLCGPEVVPAAPGVTVVLRPAAGPPRPVGLCVPCHSGRPARQSCDLGPADFAWRVLSRDAEDLRLDYASGQWLPYAAELRFAEDLARTPWTETAMRTAQRTAPPGRLSLLLNNAIFVLRHTEAQDPALRPFRCLIDALADDAEAAPRPEATAWQ